MIVSLSFKRAANLLPVETDDGESIVQIPIQILTQYQQLTVADESCHMIFLDITGESCSQCFAAVAWLSLSGCVVDLKTARKYTDCRNDNKLS